MLLLSFQAPTRLSTITSCIPFIYPQFLFSPFLSSMHQLPLNHRKRKAPHHDHTDDHPAQSRDPDAPIRPPKAPRLSWLAPTSKNPLWNSPASPHVDTPVLSPTVDPTSEHCSDPAPAIAPVSLDAATPPMIPLINRQTLRDLDFNQIVHNTLLRASPFVMYLLLNVNYICTQDTICCLTPASSSDLPLTVGKRTMQSVTGMQYLGKSSPDVLACHTILPLGNISLQYAFALMCLLFLWMCPLCSPSLHTVSPSMLPLASALCSTSFFKSFYM